VFEPTYHWATVANGQSIPPGLEVRNGWHECVAGWVGGWVGAPGLVNGLLDDFCTDACLQRAVQDFGVRGWDQVQSMRLHDVEAV